jgi:outer membrane protein OmpA-like peptidoglycan-associated protein
MVIRQSLWLIAVISAAAACSGSKPRMVTPMAQTSHMPASAAVYTRLNDDSTRGNICISNALRRACGLADDEAYFAFDLAHERTLNKKVLRTLASCLVSGPMTGRLISLIGHIDPSGPRDSNVSVARKRADNVKQIIAAETLDETAVSMLIRGTVDTKNTDEASWAEDRCIDVRCVDVMLGG